ncbi:uncharacterized protein LOC142777500 isoform X3 [Rhipicephalus microplus]|uniref:uncharacterized protein LOC142777500 isoform X3 n=1 Tax=Rhipicephalus microplus TaxID=6941 RepID=UPI003F6D520F
MGSPLCRKASGQGAVRLQKPVTVCLTGPTHPSSFLGKKAAHSLLSGFALYAARE